MQGKMKICRKSIKFRFARLTFLGRAASAGGVFLALSTVGAFGVAKKSEARQTQTSAPNLSVEGDWVRTDLNGAGDFGGLGNSIAPAQLTPEGKAMGGRGRGGGGRGPGGPAAAGTGAQHAVGDPYIVVSRPCGGSVGNGSNSFNPDSGGFHIIVSKTQVIFSEERGGSRIIFIDGRPQADTSNGTRVARKSVGHFENGVLVVDTVGLPPGGGIPGGGVRGPDTHLTERFEVSPDGQHMKIEYTYTDPKLYVKPHTYAYTFDRATPSPTYAFEEWCDASDPIERQSIVPPPQQ
jgi:hypothetical protein